MYDYQPNNVIASASTRTHPSGLIRRLEKCMVKLSPIERFHAPESQCSAIVCKYICTDYVAAVNLKGDSNSLQFAIHILRKSENTKNVLCSQTSGAFLGGQTGQEEHTDQPNQMHLGNPGTLELWVAHPNGAVLAPDGL
ncbi:hypothetical protein T265_03166 [Opisthorchis viverrini]|uniref:Uncharacterized protein n=1 Tax=Opisthorchis viverrini TaxID=6198 RepID=A0A075AHT3_OPIVI|nr:hypothetical protein T265_03166 [Opisthorchis viverrini]KER30434.1 hypothetical protein T265_03166 [Opisthorchis viverrini]